jgi:acyl carrier protein
MPVIMGLDERLYDTLAAVFGVAPESLSAESSPASIATWDSLSHLNLIMALEEEFGISFGPDDALQMHNAGVIRRMIGRLTGTEAGGGEEPVSAIVFRDCRRDDLPQVREFIARSYGAEYVLRTNAGYFDWQYRATPISQGQDYHLRLAWAEGTIVGFLGYIPVELSVAGRILRAAWLANWMVEPGQRHLGLGPALIQNVGDDFEVSLAVGANAEARDVLSRMGWTDRGMLQRYVGLLDRAGAQVLGASGSLDWPGEEVRRSASPAGVSIGMVPRFGDDVTEVWDRVYGRDGETIGTRRTAPFLNWRYADHSDFPYRLFRAEAEGRTVGFAVHRVERARNAEIRVSRIVELVADPGYEECLLSTLAADARTQGAVAADYFCGDGELDGVLQRAGYLPGDHAAAQQVPVLYQPIDRRRAGIRFLADVRRVPEADQLTRWYVSKADGDQDRPN